MKFQDIHDMRLSWLDYPDNSSHALSIYLPGCLHNCTGCQNKELQKIESPSKTFAKLNQDIKIYLTKHRTKKVVFLGGDPLLKTNNNFYFVQRFLETNPELDVCIYTGYEVDYIISSSLNGFNYIKTGKYNNLKKQESIKTEKHMVFASTNQKLYDKDLNLLTVNGVLYFEENN